MGNEESGLIYPDPPKEEGQTEQSSFSASGGGSGESFGEALKKIFKNIFKLPIGCLSMLLYAFLSLIVGIYLIIFKNLPILLFLLAWFFSSIVVSMIILRILDIKKEIEKNRLLKKYSLPRR